MIIAKVEIRGIVKNNLYAKKGDKLILIRDETTFGLYQNERTGTKFPTSKDNILEVEVQSEEVKPVKVETMPKAIKFEGAIIASNNKTPEKKIVQKPKTNQQSLF